MPAAALEVAAAEVAEALPDIEPVTEPAMAEPEREAPPGVELAVVDARVAVLTELVASTCSSAAALPFFPPQKAEEGVVDLRS